LRRIFLPEAEEELTTALHWYEAQRDGLGIEFIEAVEATMLQAVADPLRWPVWLLDDRVRRAVVQRFPYLLFYEVRPDAVAFVAVTHARRESGYWLHRIPRP
jgi:plasmid stabilization system protein ParE